MPVPKPSAADAEMILRQQFRQAVDAIQIKIDLQLTADIQAHPRAEWRKIIIDPYERGMGQPYTREALWQALESYDDWETEVKDTIVHCDDFSHAGWEVTFK